VWVFDVVVLRRKRTNKYENVLFHSLHMLGNSVNGIIPNSLKSSNLFMNFAIHDHLRNISLQIQRYACIDYKCRVLYHVCLAPLTWNDELWKWYCLQCHSVNTMFNENQPCNSIIMTLTYRHDYIVSQMLLRLNQKRNISADLYASTNGISYIFSEVLT
jgi:hypothetical protein